MRLLHCMDEYAQYCGESSFGKESDDPEWRSPSCDSDQATVDVKP
jgi:hypothetical protein